MKERRNCGYYRLQNLRRRVPFLALLVLLVFMLFGTVYICAGQKTPKASLYKYYKSIEVKPGDTLWTIADQYLEGYNQDKRTYIEELRRMNSLGTGDYIRSGDYIVVAYYSSEIK